MNAMRTTRNLARYTLVAADGEVGRIEDYYFDGATWVIRYLWVNVCDWLPGRYVLILPVAVGEIDDEQKVVYVELTRQQIKDSPVPQENGMISREYEVEYYKYYNWTPYWELDPFSGFKPRATHNLHSTTEQALIPPYTGQRNLDIESAKGFSIYIADGSIGHLEELFIDIRNWVIRYFIVATNKSWTNNRLLVSTAWPLRVSWQQRRLFFDLAAEAMKTAPGYVPSNLLNREYERKLFRHYGYPGYWQSGVRLK